MKRSLATLFGLAATAVIWAQAPFTIVRPADGAKVREKIRIQIPKGSIPEGSYVGIYVGGKFIEATILGLNGKFHEYVLDTKGRGIPDGKVKLEVVLYAETAERPRVIDRSSVEVSVQNVVSIPVPEDGFLLRYKFVPRTELAYGVEERTSISTISETQARAGGRAALLPIDSEKFRFLYAVDNRYGDGDGLLRMQALPTRNKDYAILRTVQEPEGKKYYDFEMHPLYMRVTNTGREEFGSIPMYVPLEGTAGEQMRTDLFAVFPLPSLPEKRVKPGDSWQSGIHLPKLDLENREEVNSLTAKQFARGELLGVEWEMGHPCAKIKYSIAAGQGSRPGGRPTAGAGAPAGQSRDNIGDDRVQLEQTFWFALDKGVVVKSVLDITRDIKIAAAPAAGAGGPAGGPPGAGGGGPQAGGASAPGGGRGGGVGTSDIGFVQGPSRQGGPPPGVGPGGPPPGVGGRGGVQGPPGRPGQGGGRPGGAGQMGGRTGGGSTASNQLMRIRQQLLMILEK